MIQECRSSGLTDKDWCREHGVSGNSFYYNVKKLKKQLKFMFIGTGKEDGLITASEGLDKYLTDGGLKHTFYKPEGGHTWMNCRDYLELTVKELFK